MTTKKELEARLVRRGQQIFGRIGDGSEADPLRPPMPPLKRLRWQKVRCFKPGDRSAGKLSNAIRYVTQPPDARLINVRPFLVLEPCLPAGWALWECATEPEPGELPNGEVVRGFDSLRHAKAGTRAMLLAVPDPRTIGRSADRARLERMVRRRKRARRAAGRLWCAACREAGVFATLDEQPNGSRRCPVCDGDIAYQGQAL